jgi:hypothetical protein
MSHGWSPPHERVAALAFDKQAGSAQLETWLNATERKPLETSTATSPPAFFYWIYERRLLNQLQQKPTPRHIGIILDGNRRHARKRGLSDPCQIYQRNGDDLRRDPLDLLTTATTLLAITASSRKNPNSATLSGSEI